MRVKMNESGRTGVATSDPVESGRYMVRLGGGTTLYGVERSEFTVRAPRRRSAFAEAMESAGLVAVKGARSGRTYWE